MATTNLSESVSNFLKSESQSAAASNLAEVIGSPVGSTVPITVASATARKNTETYVNPLVVGLTRVIQSDLPGIIWNLIAADATQDSSWIGLPYTTDPDGDVVVSMKLADVYGTVPDDGVLARVGDTLVLGDGQTTNGRLITSVTNNPSLVEYFSLDVTSAINKKAFKFVTTYANAFTVNVKSSTGYARMMNFDGTLQAVVGSGSPSSQLSLSPKATVSPYNSRIPKFYAIYPCTAGGSADGNLTYIYTGNTSITAVDVLSLSAVEYLGLLSQKLSSFSGEGLSAVTEIDISGNLLKSFSGVGMPSLKIANLRYNTLTNFNNIGTPLLENLDLTANPISSFDTSRMATMKKLNLSETLISSFDGSGLSTIAELYLGYNTNLTSVLMQGISVQNDAELNYYPAIDLPSCGMSAAALNALYTSLAPTTGCYLAVGNNPGSATDTPSIATAKGYTVS